jgi:hypothetical protein
MTRSIAIASLTGLALLLSGAARAERLAKGRSLVLIEIGGHRGEFVSVVPALTTAFPGAVFRNESGEVGGEIAYYRFLSDQWTLGISGGYHASRVKTDELDLTLTSDTHSFTVRTGGDRYAFIDDNVALYAGPGVFFARGQWKSKADDITIEGPDATEVGLNGRIGMYGRLGKGWALVGHIGQVLSHTSGKNSIGKISWWSSTHEGAVGMAFDF